MAMPNPRKAANPRTPQACNACKRRKVRCTGRQPCPQCQHHALPCVFTTAPVVARGRSRLGAAERGTIIAESRRALFQANSLSPPNPERSDAHYDAAYFYNLLPQYMERVHPLTPILDEAEISANIRHMAADHDAAALAYASAAITLLLQLNDKPWAPNCYRQAMDLLALSIDHHKPLALTARPTLTRLLSRLYLEMCLLVLHKCEHAFFYLREAMSLMLMQGLDRFLDGDSPDPKERTRRERIYWLCFIHERHLTIEASMPVLLDPLPCLPDVSGTSPVSIERSWNLILQSFIVIDHDFVRFWTGNRKSVTAEWILKKHHELTDETWQCQVATLPITQQADLAITRQWLRTLTWQMAMSNALLSSEATQSEGLSLFLPLRLSVQLKGLLTRMSSEAIEMHGIGMIEKLFEITTTVADVVVALMAGNYPEETRSRLEDFLFVRQFLLALPHLKPIHKEILGEKMSYIRSMCNDDSLDGLIGNDNLE